MKSRIEVNFNNVNTNEQENGKADTSPTLSRAHDSHTELRTMTICLHFDIINTKHKDKGNLDPDL